MNNDKSTEPNPSVASFQSGTTVTSTTPLAKKQRPPPKDYAAALGTLQSRYGTAGYLPSPKSHPSTKLLSAPSDATTGGTSASQTDSSSTLEASPSTSVGPQDAEGKDKKKKKSTRLFSFFHGEDSHYVQLGVAIKHGVAEQGKAQAGKP